MTTAGPGSVARRLASVVSIIVASAALLATSPSPTPPPAIDATASGEVELSADAPIATIDLRVRIGGSVPDRTLLDVVPGVTGPEPRSFPPVVVRVIDLDQQQVLEGGEWIVTGVRSTEIASCADRSPCEARFRIVAVLADPATGPVTVEWSATAGSHFAADPAPADATLSIAANEPVIRPASEVTFASSQLEHLELGADHPRAVRSMTIAMPAVTIDGDLPSGFVLVTRIGGDRQEVYEPPVAVRVMAAATLVLDASRVGGAEATYIGMTCDPACERRYDIVLEWTGGEPAFVPTMDLQILAWAMPRTGGEAVTVTSAGATDVTAAHPRIAGTTTLTRHVPGGGRIQDVLTATLDLTDTPVTSFEGYARLTLRTSAPGPADDRVRFDFAAGDSPVVHAAAGASIVVVSPIVDVDCPAQRCPVTFDVLALQQGPERALDFALDLEVEFIAADASAGPPSGATVDLSLAPKR